MSNSRAAQLVEAGMWLRLSGDHEGARRLFEQALRLDPENARARQLLESAPTSPAPAAPPVAEVKPAAPDYPFAPPATSTPMDLDWGSATGFAPTPIPFIPPVAVAPPAPVPTAPPVEDLPVELDIESVPIDFSDDGPAPTLVFGGTPDRGPIPDPQPTVPEPWSEPPSSSPTMAFQGSSGEEVPWAIPPVAPDLSGGTMQFARPPEAPPAGDTIQFARPTAPEPDSAGGTMQFARPASVAPPIEPVQSSGTMQFARSDSVAPPIEPDLSSGTMQFARPSDILAAAAPPFVQAGGTMQFARPAEANPSSAPPSIAPLVPPPVQAVPEIAEGEWDLISSPSAVFTAPMIAPIAASQPGPRGNPYDLPPPGPPPSEPKFAPNATSAWDQRSNPGIKIADAAPGLGAALDLVAADRPPVSSPPQGPQKLDEVKTLMRGAKDLLGLDDHTGAMDLILKAQELAPNDAEVQALRDRSERTLEAMFESKLGKLSSTPRVKLKDDEIIWLNLDHRAGFVLAQIDGQVTFEDLFSVSGMSRLDTARILAQLIEEGVIIR